ncbi:MAG TPA: hypothetical protein VFI13_02135, partial [Gemmatimonadales bacterium]|nr:hypothetical protein [Gemmatimonadales bacterium]
MTAARGRLLLATALLLGVSGDLLFRADALGLNFAGWVGLAVFAALLGAWEAPIGFDRTRRSRDLLVSLAVMFAAAAATTLRAAPTLVAYDVLAVLTAAAFALWTARGRSLARTRVRDIVEAWRTA